MEHKKPAVWENQAGAPKPQATEMLASAIRIEVTGKPKTPLIETTKQPAEKSDPVPLRPIVRAQTPLPTRRQHNIRNRPLAA